MRPTEAETANRITAPWQEGSFDAIVVPTVGSAGPEKAAEEGSLRGRGGVRGQVNVNRERKLSNNETTRLRVGDSGAVFCLSEENSSQIVFRGAFPCTAAPPTGRWSSVMKRAKKWYECDRMVWSQWRC